MSEREFEAYLNLLARTLKLSEAQRQRISGELRDHLEERLQELTDDGVDRETAILQALDEFGDANVLAHNLTHSRKLQPMKQLTHFFRPRRVALAALVLGVLGAGLYRLTFVPTPPNSISVTSIPVQPATPQTQEPVPQALIETSVYDADASFWQALSQLRVEETSSNASVLLLPGDAATALPQHLKTKSSVKRLSAPNLLVPLGEYAELLVGERQFGDQPNHVHDSGVGLHITPWWHAETETLEMAFTFYTHRAFDSQTQQPIATGPSPQPQTRLESTSIRAWLQNGQAIAIRTSMPFADKHTSPQPGQNRDRVLLVRATPMHLPNQERLSLRHRLLPADLYTHEDLQAFLSSENRWDRLRLAALLDMSGLEIETLTEALTQQLEARQKTLAPVFNQPNTERG